MPARGSGVSGQGFGGAAAGRRPSSPIGIVARISTSRARARRSSLRGAESASASGARVGNRCSGSGSRARRRALRTRVGTPLRRPGRSCRARIDSRRAWGLAPAYGRSPNSASKRAMAKENWSERASTGLPSSCSRAMYAGVPTSAPTRVRSDESTLASSLKPGAGSFASSGRARPKSVMRTRPSRPTRMFSGFTSRWTMPASCAAISPSAAWWNTPSVASTERPPSSHARRFWPSTSSMATNTSSPARPVSNTATTLGCPRRAIIRASRWSRAWPATVRSLPSSPFWWAVARPARSLSATRRPSSTSRAE